MHDLRKWYQGTLPASVEALKAIRKTLEKSPEGLDSVRRIARTLGSAAESHGFTALGQAARAAEHAPSPAMGRCLEKLMAELARINAMDGTGDAAVILVIQADLQMAGLLETLLSGPDREIVLAGSAGEALGVIENRPVNLIILDLMLPDTDGRNFLVVLRERSSTSNVPVIVLSGMNGTQPKTECFALGADAYFEKPLAPEVLKAVVSARLHNSVETGRQARQDALTGLPNRAAFVDGFARLAALGSRNQEPACLALLDFDFLRRINDALGHVAGDAALRHAARAFSSALRRSDLLARWGGDGFALLLPGARVDGARRALDNMFGALAASPFYAPDGSPIILSFSAGLVLARPGSSLEEAMAEADRYLYQAKTGGRGRVCWEG